MFNFQNGYFEIDDSEPYETQHFRFKSGFKVFFFLKIIETAFNASFRVRMMTISRMGVLGPCFLLRSKSSMILTLIHNLIFSFVVVLNY